jgi:hypothetical protein
MYVTNIFEDYPYLRMQGRRIIDIINNSPDSVICLDGESNEDYENFEEEYCLDGE